MCSYPVVPALFVKKTILTSPNHLGTFIDGSFCFVLLLNSGHFGYYLVKMQNSLSENFNFSWQFNYFWVPLNLFRLVLHFVDVDSREAQGVSQAQ